MLDALLIYLGLVTVMSLVCVVVYFLDKRQAGAGSRRVRERTLHLLAFLGGWPGAIFAMRRFRHKTQKGSFRLMFGFVLLCHFTALLGVLFVVHKLSSG